MRRRGFGAGLLLLFSASWFGLGAGFSLPTANRALLEAGGGGEKYFVGTAGKPWTSGQFGCVRTEGRQLHEGLDIRCVQRDRKGEPLDPVLAAADGTVAYVNLKPSLSNYGNYVVVRHVVDRIEIHTLYAHLASVVPGLKAGQAVKAGERLATMGRTSNTRQRITQDRAHLHFEICFRAGQNYSAWHRKFQVGTRNDHGEFNGRNFIGIDPAPVLLAAQQGGTNFSLARHLAMQPEMARVFVRDPRFSWVSRFPGLVQRNVAAEKEGVAGWEIAMAFNGAPLRLIPRTAKEVPGADRIRLLAVNEAVWRNHPCSKLVVRRGQAWTALPALEDILGIAGF
jgi:hypothetical protein